jgi:predicted flap endonuclease-1-like 5' DNA nuclease
VFGEEKVESLLSVSPWRELFWIAIGALFFSLLCVSGALLRAALWPPPRTARRTTETRTQAAVAGGRSDDLETIEGIGPAIAALLRTHRIRSFADLAEHRPGQLRRILLTDPDLALAEPSTWAFQARLLAEGRYGDFVRLIAMLRAGVPRLESVVDECCAGRLRAGGICTVAELQRSTVARVVECFPQNDRAQITRLAPRWIEHAACLHEGDEASLCALAGLSRVSGAFRAETVRADARRTEARTASAAETMAADTALVAYWRRESRLRLLCAPLGGLALLLLLLLIALLGLIPSARGGNSSLSVHGGGTTISMIQNEQPSGPYWSPPYPPYPSPYPSPYPPPYPPPYPSPYPPYPWPYPPYPPVPPAPCAGCPTCQQSSCPTPTPPRPQPQACACDVCGCDAEPTEG